MPIINFTPFSLQKRHLLPTMGIKFYFDRLTVNNPPPPKKKKKKKQKKRSDFNGCHVSLAITSDRKLCTNM